MGTIDLLHGLLDRPDPQRSLVIFEFAMIERPKAETLHLVVDGSGRMGTYRLLWIVSKIYTGTITQYSAPKCLSFVISCFCHRSQSER